MRTHRDDLTADYVREILDYNPKTGIFIWKKLSKYRIFLTAEEAYAAYCKRAKELYGEFFIKPHRRPRN